MQTNIERAAQLAAILGRRFPECRPHMVARTIVAALRAAARARRAEEHACSYPEPEGSDERRLKRFARTAEALRLDMAHALDLPQDSDAIAFRFGGDPRGPCAWMRIRDAAGAWMPGDGWDSDAGFPLV